MFSNSANLVSDELNPSGGDRRNVADFTSFMSYSSTTPVSVCFSLLTSNEFEENIRLLSYGAFLSKTVLFSTTKYGLNPLASSVSALYPGI